MSRREYEISITINRRPIKKVIIDPHYEEKHSESISDEIILELVQLLDQTINQAKGTDSEGFEYYVSDPLVFNKKDYRLVWLLHEQEVFIGIVNAFRR